MQKAILLFRDYKGKDFISGISQPQNYGSHKLLNGANDWNGRSGYPEQCDLLAPYDCKVMAIARADNTVFFQSLNSVQTPSGVYEHCWFMATHMNDADFNKMGYILGKVFKQGERCYTEGSKNASAKAYHIHMEQGYGTFAGGNLPYYASSDYYTWNGKTYRQYYPNCKGAECPVWDMFYLGSDDLSLSEAEKAQGAKYYAQKWKRANEKDETAKDDATVIELQMALSEARNTIQTMNEQIAALTKRAEDAEAQSKANVKEYRSKMLQIKKKADELINELG